MPRPMKGLILEWTPIGLYLKIPASRENCVSRAANKSLILPNPVPRCLHRNIEFAQGKKYGATVTPTFWYKFLRSTVWAWVSPRGTGLSKWQAWYNLVGFYRVFRATFLLLFCSALRFPSTRIEYESNFESTWCIRAWLRAISVQIGQSHSDFTAGRTPNVLLVI